MSDDGSDEDKQYEPSQKKLDDARVKGEVAKSNDLTTSAGYAGLMIAILAVGPASLIAAASTLTVLLDQATALSADLFAGAARPFGGSLGLDLGRALWALGLAPGIFALLVLLAQRGLVFAPTKLQPKLSRISIIKGFANKFGRAGLFEFAKSFAKLLLYSFVLGVYLNIQLPRILGTTLLTPTLIAAEMGRLCIGLFAVVILIAFAIGGVDFLFQKAEHQRKHRMSRKEMMDEQKQSEGDPMMKQQRRQKAVTMAMNKMLADVPTADVIIVNPTHYAVALRWDRGSGRAPICVAKGVDEIAARIRELAHEHRIAIHRDPPTSRAVYDAIDIGTQILPEHYQAVAAAIRFAEGLRAKARSE